MMDTAAYATEVTASSVNKTLQNILEGYSTVISKIDALDANLLNDMNVLFDRQMETLTALETVNKAVTTVPVETSEKVLFHVPLWKPILVVGVSIYAYKVLKSKKEK